MTGGSLVLGVLNGFTFGLLALGIVLVYKSNRFVNLCYAQLGAVPALVLAKFVLEWRWSWWEAFGLCVLVGVGTGLLVDWGLVSRLRARTHSAVSLLLLTVGVSEVLLAFTYIPALGPGSELLATAGYPLPFHTRLTIGNVVLGGQDVLTMVLAPVLVLALAWFLRYSALGKQIRAAASNADAARLAGVSVRRASAVTWGIAGGLSAITAILQAPSQGTFNAAALGPGLLLLALGGAAFGAFISIPGALAGGLVLGVGQQLTLSETKNGGTADLVVLLLILGVILARGRAIGRVFATSGAVVEDRSPLRVPAALAGRWVVTRQRVMFGGLALIVAALLPYLPVLRSESRRFELSVVVIYALVAVSLAVLVGWAGQVSLGHFALVGTGAFVTARLAADRASILVILVVAGLAGAALMVLVGLPALRVPGLSLAVTSLGLAVIGPEWLFRQHWLGSAQPFGIDVQPLPMLSGVGRPSSEAGVYYLGLTLLTVVLLGLAMVRRSAPGRVIIAVRDNERAAASFGLTPAAVKLLALATSGFIAAMAGVVWADAWRSVATTQFSPDVSIALLAAPVVGGIATLGGAVAGAVVIYGSAFFVSPSLTALFGSFGSQLAFQLALGGSGIIVTLLVYPSGIAGAAQDRWQRLLDHLADARRKLAPAQASAPLVVEGVRLAFGGIQALRGASIRVDAGEIVGLIGPNGAGKTTLMNVISGVLGPAAGSVSVFGHEVAGLAPEYRAAFGVARSFQDAHLFPGLTVTETVQLATRRRVGVLSAATRAPWAREVEATSLADATEIIERLGLSAWANSLTSELSTGSRRICDLAAQVASRPALLLLDEPTAGIAQREAEAFGPVLRRVRDELGCAVLIIEHDMPLLMGLCDRVYAMDAGAVIAEGTPDEIRANALVVASYLGTGKRAINRSGSRSGSAARSGARSRAVGEGNGKGPAPTGRAAAASSVPTARRGRRQT